MPSFHLYLYFIDDSIAIRMVRCGQRSIIIQNDVGFFSGTLNECVYFLSAHFIFHAHHLQIVLLFETQFIIWIGFAFHSRDTFAFFQIQICKAKRKKNNIKTSRIMMKNKWKRKKAAAIASRNAKVILNFLKMGVGLALSIESDRTFIILHTK